MDSIVRILKIIIHSSSSSSLKKKNIIIKKKKTKKQFPFDLNLIDLNFNQSYIHMS